MIPPHTRHKVELECRQAHPPTGASCMPDSNDSTPSKSFGWDRFWFALDHEVQTYHDANPGHKPIRPGELAFASGVVLSDFHEYLQEKGYTLTEDERWTIVQVYGRDHSKKGKPVVILKRLGKGRYLACRASSWGGKNDVSNIVSPVQKNFAFAMSAFMEPWPPRAKHLRVSPPSKKSSAVIAMPLELDDVKHLRWMRRSFLGIGQLERLESFIRLRAEEFPPIAEKLRESEVRVQKLKLQPFNKWPPDMQDAYRKAENVAEINLALSKKDFPEGLSVLSRRLRLRNHPTDVLIKYRDKKPPQLSVPQCVDLLPWYSRTPDELIDCDILTDPVRTGFDIDKSKKMKYYTPRVVVGRENSGAPGWRTSRPFRKPRKYPPPPSARTFSSVAWNCGSAARLLIPRIPFG